MLAINQITKYYTTYGYIPTAHNPGLCKHQTRPISFTLVVDEVVLKYVGLKHAEHLVSAIVALYPLTTDREGKLYCGLTLNWDYSAHTVGITMPGYNPSDLQNFQHPNIQRPQHSPHY